jgi:hypothetical protein
VLFVHLLFFFFSSRYVYSEGIFTTTAEAPFASSLSSYYTPSIPSKDRSFLTDLPFTLVMEKVIVDGYKGGKMKLNKELGPGDENADRFFYVYILPLFFVYLFIVFFIKLYVIFM